MFFTIRTLLLCFMLSVFPIALSAQEQSPARVCFNNAVHVASQTGDFLTTLRQFISVPNIAQSAGWKKWRIRWENLDENQITLLMNTVNSVLDDLDEKMFQDIDYDSLRNPDNVRESQTRYGTKLWGSYNLLSGGRDTFELHIVPRNCKVTRLVWENVTLSWYVAQKL